MHLSQRLVLSYIASTEHVYYYKILNIFCCSQNEFPNHESNDGDVYEIQLSDSPHHLPRVARLGSIAVAEQV